jgi:hypothetical protein
MTKEVTIVDVIQRALPLVENEETWLQGSFAQDADGNTVSRGFHPRAVRWCALGALEKAAFDLTGNWPDTHDCYCRALEKLNGLSPDRTLSFVNDEEGREAVVKLFKKALAA